MIASLPMYDRAETRGANDRLWQAIRTGIRDSFRAAPEALSRDGGLWSHWRSPELLLSQTCGLPFCSELNAKVNLIATPVHDIPCPPGHYFSVLVARSSDPRRELAEFSETPVAINGGDSQSGWGALWKLARDQGVALQNLQVSGSHRASCRAVAEGLADLAAIDVVSWRMIRRWDGFARNLHILAETPPTPALPYITAPDMDPAPLRIAIAEAIRSLTPEDRDALCLTGVTDIPPASYRRLPVPPEPWVSPPSGDAL